MPTKMSACCPSTDASDETIQGRDAANSPKYSSLLRARFSFTLPTAIATVLFLLIFSGPPKLRFRDPQASIRGELDWVVVLHIVVWALAGLWVAGQLENRRRTKKPLLRMHPPQILALGMILSLTLSIFVSAAPALTAFKVYQMVVAMFFTQIFAEKFGARNSLRVIFWGNVLLCVVIAVCAFLAPDLVWGPSDFSWDPSRLRGDLIASTGVVSTFAIILMLTRIRKVWGGAILPLCLFFGLLTLSLMRTAYVIVLVFFVLALVRGHNLRLFRQLGYLACAIFLFLWASDWRPPSLNQYRNPESISTLSDRIGLWSYLGTVTLHRSPWLGLGYYAASRIYGPEYNPGLGTAHSIFFEALSGGGLPAFAALVLLCGSLLLYSARIFYTRKDQFSLAAASLLIASLLFGGMGEEIDAGPVAITFWYLVAVLPVLCGKRITLAPDRTFNLARVSR